MNRTPILNMWNSVLGNSIANKHIAYGKKFGILARTLLFYWIILWFILRNTYQGALYTYLQSNRVSSPYDKIEKVIESDCKIVIPPTVDSFILKDVKDQERYASISSFKFIRTWIIIRCIFTFISNFSILHRENEFYTNQIILYDENIEGVALSTDLSQRSFNLENSPNRHLAFTKDRLLMYSPVFLYPKKSMLRDTLNEQMLTLRETGLIEFWIRSYTDDRKEKIKQRDPSTLRIENIFAAFEICGILYLISFIVFILEMISRKSRIVKYALDFLTY